MMSDVCKHWVSAPCQHACPTGAIIYNEFANVYIQRDICNGCSYCIAACPFGVITRSDFDGHSHKCTLCYDRQKDGLVPACAKACPTQSIQFGPIDELRERARNRVKTPGCAVQPVAADARGLRPDHRERAGHDRRDPRVAIPPGRVTCTATTRPRRERSSPAI
jgi:Fe-S-cluster-containing dehydrogenase component